MSIQLSVAAGVGVMVGIAVDEADSYLAEFENLEQGGVSFCYAFLFVARKPGLGSAPCWARRLSFESFRRSCTGARSPPSFP
jgi:hypothetical protein